MLIGAKLLPADDWLSKKKGKYTSHVVHNQLLTIMRHQVLNKLLIAIRKNIYPIICFEYTDCSNRELLGFYLHLILFGCIRTFPTPLCHPDVKSIPLRQLLRTKL